MVEGGRSFPPSIFLFRIFYDPGQEEAGFGMTLAGAEISLAESGADRGAMRLAFRLALLDAAGTAGNVAERCARLEAARGLLAAALAAGGAVPGVSSEAGPVPSGPISLNGVRDRAAMAAALQGGFDEAWAEVSGGR
jgi:hypothetical protein